MTPEMMGKIAVWRQKALDNTLTLDEMKEAIKALRGDRVGASIASEKSRTKKAPKMQVSADDLLAELGDL